MLSLRRVKIEKYSYKSFAAEMSRFSEAYMIQQGEERQRPLHAKKTSVQTTKLP